MKTIFLQNSEIAILDDSVNLPDEKWTVNAQGYAAFLRRIKPGRSGRRWTFMHHFILPPAEGMVIDHINGNKLDNRLSNLRMATRQQNSFNRSKNKNNTTGFSGVHFKKSRGKWYAKVRISINGKRKSVERGYFSTKEEANTVAVQIRRDIFGEFARP